MTMMPREHAIRILDTHYAPHEHPGCRLLVDVVTRMGYAAALSDEALSALALAHLVEHGRLSSEAEREALARLAPHPRGWAFAETSVD